MQRKIVKNAGKPWYLGIVNDKIRRPQSILKDQGAAWRDAATARLVHLLELAEQGPTLRAALAEEVAELLTNWPGDCPNEMRGACEALLARAAREVDDTILARLEVRLSSRSGPRGAGAAGQGKSQPQPDRNSALRRRCHGAVGKGAESVPYPHPGTILRSQRSSLGAGLQGLAAFPHRLLNPRDALARKSDITQYYATLNIYDATKRHRRRNSCSAGAQATRCSTPPDQLSA